MPDISTKQDYALYQQTVAQFVADEGISFLSTGTESNLELSEYDASYNHDAWFSWSPCEMCGCSLGGNREYLFARNAADELVQFTICEDCVYYVAYGRLDDMTMQRVEDSVSSPLSQG